MKRSNPIRSILAACAVLASSAVPASAAQHSYALSWTSPSTASATGTMTLDDAVCVSPGMNSIMNGPAGCIVDIDVTITGAGDGNGNFQLSDFAEILLMPTGPLDYEAELLAQGMSDVNFFGNAPAPTGVAPFVMRPFGTNGADDLTLAAISPIGSEPQPEFPFSTDAEQCAEAVGKAGASYFAARHKALHACRSSLMKGTALFTDKSKTTLVASSDGCPGERKAAAAIARAQAKAQAVVEKKCTDALLATIFACAATVDGLVDGATGCLIESTNANVDGVLDAEFGF